MKTLNKCFIDFFGEESVSHVEEMRPGEYIVRTDKHGYFLAMGKELKGYLGDIIRIMYTGEKYGTGDFILVSDRHGIICKFRDGNCSEYWIGKRGK